MTHPLSTKSKRIYDRVFQHPLSHNLEWQDVQSLFEAIGEVEAEHNGNLKLMVGENAMVVQSPRMSENVGEDQIMALRHLLRSKKAHWTLSGPHLLIVIDHQEARLFEMEKENSQPIHIKPFNKDGHEDKLHGPRDFMEHRENRDMGAYFESICDRMDGPGEVLVFGSGQGQSSAMESFMHWLQTHRPALYAQVIGAYAVDESHMSENQLLARAKEIYAL